MNQSSKLVFFGTEDFSLPSLQALVEAGFDIVTVVTKPDSPRGRSKKLVEPAVKRYAMENNIAIMQPSKLSDINDQLADLHADAGVLVSYGKLLPQRTLDVFSPIGIVNVHPSLLPRYRGPAPIEAAIVNGDKITGISIMKLTLGMDEGPVYAQETVELSGNETKPQLTKLLASRGAEFLVKTLPEILSEKISAVSQDNSDVSYTTLISKEDGILDPSTDTAYALERKVRAYLGYPKSRVKIQNTDVIITSVKVVESLEAGALVIACSDGTYLEIEELVAPSGKNMDGNAFVRGYFTA